MASPQAGSVGAGVDAGWRVIGRSVRGASHVRAELPNQDAIAWRPASGAGLPLVVAVSDGHGSAKSFRSDLGAKLATEIVLAELEQAAVLSTSDAATSTAQLSAVKRMAQDVLPDAIARRWREAVEAHLAAHPFTDEEWAKLEKKDGAAGRARVEKNPPLAYGATLLATLVTRSYIIYLQLGDGDILAVAESGEVVRPLARDERLFANETTSLCAKDAARELRVAFHALTDGAPPPALILVSTDGYANSFRDESGFVKVGPDLLESLATDGVEGVDKELEGWLGDASTSGSGDDVTLGLLCRTGAFPSVKARLAAAAAASPSPAE